jgi:hypothetical protein
MTAKNPAALHIRNNPDYIDLDTYLAVALRVATCNRSDRGISTPSNSLCLQTTEPIYANSHTAYWMYVPSQLLHTQHHTCMKHPLEPSSINATTNKRSHTQHTRTTTYIHKLARTNMDNTNANASPQAKPHTHTHVHNQTQAHNLYTQERTYKHVDTYAQTC